MPLLDILALFKKLVCSFIYFIYHLFDIHFFKNGKSRNYSALQTADKLDVENVKVVGEFIPSGRLCTVINIGFFLE